jgi:hypothetical protein
LEGEAFFFCGPGKASEPTNQEWEGKGREGNGCLDAWSEILRSEWGVGASRVADGMTGRGGQGGVEGLDPDRGSN